MKCPESRFILWLTTSVTLVTLSGCIQLDRFNQVGRTVPFQPPAALSSLDHALDQRDTEESQMELTNRRRGRLRNLFDSQASVMLRPNAVNELDASENQKLKTQPLMQVRTATSRLVDRSL